MKKPSIQERNWEMSFNAITDLISVQDRDFKIIRVNKAYADAFKMKPEELIGKTCYEVVHKTREPWPKCPHRQALETKKPVREEFFEPRLGLYLAVSVAPIFDKRGEVTGTIHMVRDITECKQAEEALIESETWFKSIFDNATEGILLADLEKQTFFTGNQAICQMLGYEQEEIENLSLMDIHPQEDIPYVLEQFEKQAKQEITLATDLPVKKKDGSVFYADINSNPITLAGKTYMMGFFRDITERKKAQEKEKKRTKDLERAQQASLNIMEDLDRRSKELEASMNELRSTQEKLIQAEKIAALGRLTAAVAHELNNPLASVIGFSEAVLLHGLKNKELNRDRLKNSIDRVLNNAYRCKSIINRLLSYGEGFAAESSLVDINETIDKSISRVLGQTGLKGVKIVKEYSNNIPKIMGRKVQLSQVFLNIILNASQAMPEKGKLKIKTGRKGDYIEALFKDTGKGIKKDNLNKVFEPFFTTSDMVKGTGMGLSISASIIKAHQGEILVESEGEGKGATFTVKLPVKNGGGVMTRKKKLVPQILVIDDEPDLCYLLEDILGGEGGYEVITTPDGFEGIKRNEDSNPDLILLDLKMPQMGGIETLRRIRKKDKDVIVIILTGYGDAETVRDAADLDVYEYISKPFKNHDIISVIEEALASREKEKDA